MNVREARNVIKWVEVMFEEMKAFEKNDTCNLQELVRKTNLVFKKTKIYSKVNHITI